MSALRRILLTLALCGSLSPAWAQSLDQLAWMAGTWTQQKDGETVQEAWLGPRGGMLLGSNLSSSARRSSYEFLRIVETPAGLAYLASPGGRAPTAFRLRELGERRVVFENPDHDFPQRVIYWLETEGVLRARIEGEIQGQARSREWRFERSR